MKSITIMVICVLITGSCVADTWTVDNDGKADFNTIQAAVDAASNGDEILVAPGTYTSTSDQVVDTLGKAITLQSTLGAGVTVIDGGGMRRGVKCSSGELNSTVIQGFTITNALGVEGGGIFCSSSSPRIIDCVISGNATTGNYSYGGGGGICLLQSDAVVINCIIANNEQFGNSPYGGGIICISGNPTITDCTISNNTGSIGGGLCCLASNLTINGCTISANNAIDPDFGDGGGVLNYGGTLQIFNCSITNNTAAWGGGGMSMFGGGTTTITSCSIESNTAREGGGIYPGGVISVENSTISSNTATHIGGGVLLGSDFTITNCTIENNDAGGGGGMYCRSGSSLEIRDSTISGNTSWAGGGLWATYGSKLQLVNCVLHNNFADVLHSSGIYAHDASVVSLTDCTVSSDTNNGGEILANYSAAVVFLGTCASETLEAVIGASLRFGAESTCEISGNVVPSTEGSISFDIDDLDTTSSVSVMGILDKQGCLHVSNDSGTLAGAQIGDVIPLADAWQLTNNFESIVLPPMPEGLGLQVVEQPALRGPSISIELEVVAVEDATFANPFAGGLDSPPVDIVTFDADGDGADDIAILFGGSPGGVAAFSVSEDGSPTPISGLSAIVGNNPVSIDSGDIDGDGYDDLLVANSSDNTLTVLLTSGVVAGSMYFDSSTVAVYGSNQSVSCVAVIDWDGDDDLDAVVGVDLTDPYVEDAYQIILDVSSSPIGGTRFDIPIYVPLNGQPVADPPTAVDGGDSSNFVGGTRYGRIHRAIQGTSTLDVLGELSGNNIVTIELIDLDDAGGDGQLDLMVASDDAESIYLLQGDSVEIDGFRDLIPLAVSESISDVVAFDADDDGDIDLVMTAPDSTNPLLLLRNEGQDETRATGLSQRTWSMQLLSSITPVTRLSSGGLSPKDDEDDWVIGGGQSSNLLGDPQGVMEQTNILIGSICESDFNGDAIVNVKDLLQVIAAWGNVGGAEDLDGDGNVGVNDLLILIAAWGDCP